MVNQGSATISGWRLVVALPGDTVSAVQDAEFTEDQGVVSMTPAPYDLTVTPGNEVTVSIYASGPVLRPPSAPSTTSRAGDLGLSPMTA